MKYLIVGLGNIGNEYSNTRHNIGFILLDAYAQASNIFFQTKRYGDIAEKKVKGRQVIFLKPSTYMNLSGKAVRYWLQTENIPVENMLVIADDINLPLGKVRIRTKGSAGGHNGLKNIIDLIGHNEFNRLRFGLGKEFLPGEQSNYVLGKWTEEELKTVEERKKDIINAINSFVTIGIERTMNFYNKK